MAQSKSRTSRDSSAAPIQNQEAPEESFAIRVMTPFRLLTAFRLLRLHLGRMDDAAQGKLTEAAGARGASSAR